MQTGENDLSVSLRVNATTYVALDWTENLKSDAECVRYQTAVNQAACKPELCSHPQLLYFTQAMDLLAELMH